MKEAIKALEALIGIENTAVATTLRYMLQHPSLGHRHDAASGNGPRLAPSTIAVPSGGYPSGGNLHDHLVATEVHQRPRHMVHIEYSGSIPSGGNLTPCYAPRTMQIEDIQAVFRVPPSGATTSLDVKVGATSLWVLATAGRPNFNAGATLSNRTMASLSQVTVPSGAIIYPVVQQVGTNVPGIDLGITFLFRE
jgi:hypothetical protein